MEQVRNVLEQLDLPSIGLRQDDRLTAGITREEIIQVINSLKSNPSPGSDGYAAEWYKVFKEELMPTLKIKYY